MSLSVRALGLLVLTACVLVRSHDDDVAALQDRAEKNPRPDLDRVIERMQEPVPLLGERRAFTLPLLDDLEVPAVKMTVNGVAGRFLIDTGASHMALNAPFAWKAKAYVPPGRAGSAIAPGYSSRIHRGAAEHLELGPLKVAAFPVLVRAEQLYRRTTFGRLVLLDGGIGGSLLTQYTVTFDFKRDEVRFVPHDRPGRANVIFAAVKLNGKPYSVLVDSGADGLYLEPWAAVELGLLGETRAKSLMQEAESVKDVRYLSVRVRELEVDGKTFRDVKSRVLNTFGRADFAKEGRAAGLLGLAAFGKRVWTIDYERLVLELEK